MAIDFEAEGLLDGVSGGDREARRQLLEELVSDGASVDELRRAVEEDRLVLLPVERVLEGEGGRYTLDEVAERAGVEPGFLLRQRRALGLPTPETGERAFAEEEVEAAKGLRAFREAGLPEEGMLEMARVLGVAMSQVAAANRSLIAGVMLQPGGTERDVGLRFADAARRFGPLQGDILSFAYKLHLREQIRHDVIGRAELREGMPGTQQVAACFADMVGFTRLGEELAPEELGGVTGRLSHLAAEVATTPVRLVKMLGDAAMLVSPDAEALVSAALELLEGADAEGADFPALRAGVAQGAALPRGGDWYGRPVNLASRITAIARPGSLLASGAAREAAGEGFAYSFAGERRLKGIDGAVKLFRVRRPGP